MKTTKKDDRAGVWMDHHSAHIVTRNAAGDFFITSVETDDESINPKKEKQNSPGEHAKHMRQQQTNKNFFAQVKKELQKFDQILLSGPTTAKTEFHHLLLKTKSFKGKRIAEMNAGVMTDRQLIAFMKKNLGKPMDIFREEEYV